MSACKTYTTRKFVEPAIWIRWAAFGLMSLALVASWFFGRQQISRSVSVEPDAEDFVEVGTLTLQPQAIGATRIRAEAKIPTNQWVTYELILVDPQGEVVTSALKNAWKESGIWREDGQTGTWSEKDVDAGLDVKISEPETLTLGVSVLDYTTSDGNALTDPVTIEVRASTGVVYRTPLLWGWIVTAVLTVVSGEVIWAARGKRVMFRTLPDSDLGTRGTLGGPGNLVHMRVQIDSDETTPSSFQPQLWIRNADGEDIYTQTYRVTPNSGGGDSRQSVLHAYFQFLERGSYGFYLEVMPDASVDRTSLLVLEHARTGGKVEVTDIDNVAIVDSADPSAESIDDSPAEPPTAPTDGAIDDASEVTDDA